MAKPKRSRASDSSSSSSSSSFSSSSSSSSGSGSHSRSTSLDSGSRRSRSRNPQKTRKRSSPVAALSRLRMPPPEQPKMSSPTRKSSPLSESVVLHIGNLTRNVNDAHLKEIFSNFGGVVNVELSMDRIVQLPRGYGYVEFKTRSDAEKALLHMDGAQVDGNVVTARFTLPQRRKVSPPPRAVVDPAKKEPSLRNNATPDAIKEGAVQRKESSPLHLRSRLPQRRSPIHRRGDSPRLRGDSTPCRRPISPRRRHSPPAFRRRIRSPIRTSLRRVRGSPVGCQRLPLSHRHRSPPRRGRTPHRSSPVRRRSRSPPSRPVRSRSTSRSPRRRVQTPRKHGRSSSFSSESPSPKKRSPGGDRKLSISRSPRRLVKGGKISPSGRWSSSSNSPLKINP